MNIILYILKILIHMANFQINEKKLIVRPKINLWYIYFNYRIFTYVINIMIFQLTLPWLHYGQNKWIVIFIYNGEIMTYWAKLIIRFHENYFKETLKNTYLCDFNLK